MLESDYFFLILGDFLVKIVLHLFLRVMFALALSIFSVFCELQLLGHCGSVSPSMFSFPFPCITRTGTAHRQDIICFYFRYLYMSVAHLSLIFVFSDPCTKLFWLCGNLLQLNFLPLGPKFIQSNPLLPWHTL